MMPELSKELPGGLTPEHIRQSNLIEGVDDPAADTTSQQAWRWLTGFGQLNVDVVLKTHLLVMAGQLGPTHAGQLRRVGVRVGPWVCPPPEEVADLLTEWLDSMDAPAEQDPVERHVAFERIHPFVDGNGRVGRLLMWWHQVQLHQEPTLVRADERQDYYAWFRDSGQEQADLLYLLMRWDLFSGKEN